MLTVCFLTGHNGHEENFGNNPGCQPLISVFRNVTQDFSAKFTSARLCSWNVWKDDEIRFVRCCRN